jgi:5-methylcytosine-specific restriction endonuclease McrA
MSKLNRRVLVLNKSWIPINVCTVKRAVCLTYQELAHVVEPDTYETFRFDQWCKRKSDEMINASSISIPVPNVIVLRMYNGLRARMRVPFSRINLLKRDNYRCQYCGDKKKASELNIDHVIPKAKGGLTNWTNCVSSCFQCNNKKDDRLPRECGMELLNKPFAPTWSFYAFNSITNPKWKRFLSHGKQTQTVHEFAT